MQIRTLTIILAFAGLLAAGSVVKAQEGQPAGDKPVIERDQPAKPTQGEGVVERDDAEPQDQAGEGGDKTGQGGEQPKPPTKKQPMFPWQVIVLLGGLALLWFWMSRGRRKQQQRRRDMVENLKKGEKVVSIGGIVGTVMEVKGDEITVKVDESSNVRMKFAKWGIRGVGEAAKVENIQEAQRTPQSETK